MLTAEGMGSNTINTNAIDTLVDNTMCTDHIAGVGLGISQSGNVLYTQGYGQADIASGATVTADTPFVMASCTKTYTAWGVLYLQDQGELSISDPIGNYITLSGTNAQQFSDVPIQSFLSMSGGLEDLGTGAMDWEQILAKALDAGPVNTPGTANLYSNPSFMLMGQLIETVTGKSYDEFMQTKMLGSSALQLADTIVHTSNNTPADLAVGYAWDSSRKEFVTPTPRPPSSSFSAGAMLASGKGLAQYMAALDNQQILSPAAYEALFTVVPLTGGAQGKWALGWETLQFQGSAVWGKDGGLPGYSSYLLRDPNSGYSVTLATNTSGVAMRAFAQAIMGSL